MLNKMSINPNRGVKCSLYKYFMISDRKKGGRKC
uniref:Uncharacterized protein n=1 Tax=Siphoviridae sp. ct7aK2 TaxID=2825351 RepID=A0A8S5U9B0_9CAUD|nr:MAG TPA: hypothetical protein [Siphoviridae sp. ct7aK2]